MSRTRPTSFAFDDETHQLLHEEAAKRGLSMSGLIRAMVRALRDGRVSL